jgi:hypothetical protein
MFETYLKCFLWLAKFKLTGSAVLCLANQLSWSQFRSHIIRLVFLVGGEGLLAPNWPWTHNPPASASQVLGLQACSAIPSLNITSLLALWETVIPYERRPRSGEYQVVKMAGGWHSRSCHQSFSPISFLTFSQEEEWSFTILYYQLSE